MKKLVHNISTNTREYVDLTPDEVYQREVEQAAWAAGATERANQEIIRQLATTDGQMARVVEDVIQHLGIRASLPVSSQAVIGYRESLRAKISH